jgi:hypothetical protein
MIAQSVKTYLLFKEMKLIEHKGFYISQSKQIHRFLKCNEWLSSLIAHYNAILEEENKMKIHE